MQPISVDERDGILWIILRGDLDQQEILDLKGPFDQALESSEGDVIVDMSAVTFMGTLGIGLLTATSQRLTGEGRSLKLFGVPAAIEQTFEVMNLDETFERA